MSNRPQSPVVAKWFLVPWSLVSLWAFMPWFYRIYEHGRFRYNPYVLQFEMGWSRILLLVFGVAGIVFYERSRAALPGWSRALYILLITVAAAVLILDLIISQVVTPAP